MNTEIYTYFTTRIGSSELLYSAKQWVEVTLRLETAGPVAVSTKQEIVPVLSGAGILLPVDDDFNFVLSQENRIWIAATAVNRVNVCIKPIPYLGSILRTMAGGFAGLGRVISRTARPSRTIETSPPIIPPRMRGRR